MNKYVSHITNESFTKKKSLAFVVIVLCLGIILSGCASSKSSEDKVTLKEQEGETEAIEDVEVADNEENDLEVIGSVYAGTSTTSIIDSKGNLLICGSKSSGQLGEETVEQRTTYCLVASDIKSVCGSSSFAAISRNNMLFTWGYNGYNQLGYGMCDDSSKPTEIAKKIIDVAISDSVCAYVTQKGDLYIMGCPRVSFGDENNTRESSTPVKVMSNIINVELATNNDYGETFAVITKNNELYMWGDNSNCIVAQGTEETINKPTKVMDNIKSVSIGEEYVLAVTTENELYAWGKNHSGQLGIGTNKASNEKTKVMDNVILADAGTRTSLAVNENGELFTWGNDGYGCIGQGIDFDDEDDDVLSPIKIMDNVQSASIDGCTTIILTNSGDVYTCGWNTKGQLGTGDTKDRNVPTLVYNIYKSDLMSTETSTIKQ